MPATVPEDASFLHHLLPSPFPVSSLSFSSRFSSSTNQCLPTLLRIFSWPWLPMWLSAPLSLSLQNSLSPTFSLLFTPQSIIICFTSICVQIVLSRIPRDFTFANTTLILFAICPSWSFQFLSPHVLMWSLFFLKILTRPPVFTPSQPNLYFCWGP